MMNQRIPQPDPTEAWTQILAVRIELLDHIRKQAQDAGNPELCHAISALERLIWDTWQGWINLTKTTTSLN